MSNSCLITNKLICKVTTKPRLGLKQVVKMTFNCYRRPERGYVPYAGQSLLEHEEIILPNVTTTTMM